MSRHREVAASPARNAGEAWAAIGELVATTLDRSSRIDPQDVYDAFAALVPVGRALVSGGHLDRDAMTVVAEPLFLSINCVSGESALSVIDSENANPVPGAATALDWMIYLPRPTGLVALIDDVVEGMEHISTEEPPPESQSSGRAKSTDVVGAIDFSRLDVGPR
ncbi:MAG: hypothetical protein GY788_28020 [bacterium]|nr:hypothetical protein [bacterium]